MSVTAGVFSIAGRIGRWTARLFRRTWRWTVAVLLLLGVAHGVATFVLGRRVEAEIARIKASGDPVSYADLAGPAIPASENGALDFEKATRILAAMPDSMHKYESPQFSPEECAKHPEMWDDVRREMGQYSQVFSLVEKGAAKPKFRYTSDWKSGSDARFRVISRLRSLVRLLNADAEVKAHFGDMQGAAHSIELAVATSESLKGDPLLINMLVRVATLAITTRNVERIARSVPVDYASFERISRALSRPSLQGEYVRTLKGERVYLISNFQEFRQGGFSRVLHLGQCSPMLRLRGYWLGRPWLYADELECLRRFDARIRTGDRPYRSSLELLYHDTPNFQEITSLPDLLTPVYRYARARIDQADTGVRGTQLLLALQVYRSRFGVYPATLPQLAAKLNWGLSTEDPFSGRQMIYRTTGSGFLLYSIGSNLKDDGGIDWRDPRVRSASEGDIVWKMDR